MLGRLLAPKITPLTPGTADAIDYDILLDHVESIINNRLENFKCPISLSVPIIPLKALELKIDGRFFTPHVFEAEALFQHLLTKNTHPVNRQKLTRRDIGKYLLPDKELISTVDNILREHGVTRQKYLRHFGISKDLYHYILNHDFSLDHYHVPEVIQAIYESTPAQRLRNSEFPQRLDRITRRLFFSLLCIIAVVNIYLISDIAIHEYDKVFNFLQQLQKNYSILIPAVFEAIPNMPARGLIALNDLSQYIGNQNYFQLTQDAFNSITAISSLAFQFLINPSISVPLTFGASTLFISREVFLAMNLYQSRKPFSEESQFKKSLLAMASFCILVLGFDAITDWFGLSGFISEPTGLSKTMTAIIPLTSITASFFYGKKTQKAKGEIAFEEFEKRGCKY